MELYRIKKQKKITERIDQQLVVSTFPLDAHLPKINIHTSEAPITVLSFFFFFLWYFLLFVFTIICEEGDSPINERVIALLSFKCGA